MELESDGTLVPAHSGSVSREGNAAHHPMRGLMRGRKQSVTAQVHVKVGIKNFSFEAC